MTPRNFQFGQFSIKMHKMIYQTILSPTIVIVVKYWRQIESEFSVPENYTVKLARAKLPGNAGNITCSSQVKRSLAQFTCVTCSLPVNTGKFTCFEAASTSRRTHANCLRAHESLPEYHRHFTGSFNCGTHANFPRLACKIACFCRQKYMQLTGKNTGIAGKITRQTQPKITANSRKNTRTIAGKKTCNSSQNYLQLQAIWYHTAGKFTCKFQVS